MATGRITKSSVDALRAVAGKPAFLWDNELRGLGVKATPAGRKVYLVQYRLGGRGGRAQRVTLGTHGNITADEARQKAKQVLGKIADGIDVAAEKRKQKQVDRSAPTIAELAADFIEILVKAKRKPSTRAAYERLLGKLVLPALGQRRVRDVTRGDVERWHLGLKATPIQGNRALAVLSTLFSWAIRGDYRPDRQNPCAGIEKFKEEPRKRYLSERELAVLGAALREAESIGAPWAVDETKPTAKHVPKQAEHRRTKIDLYAAAAIRLFVLTGARLGEILTLKWAYLDLDAGVLRLPDSKTGAKILNLNAPALAVLAALPRDADNPYVIPGELPGKHRIDIKRPWNMVRKLAGFHDVHIHDLRHTTASVAVASNVSLALIGGLLGHKSQQTTQRYAHLSDDPLRDAAEKVGARVQRAMEQVAGAKSGAVMPLKLPVK